MNPEGTGTNPLWEMYGPIIAQLGFGGLLGWSVGFFVKKGLKLVGILIAIIFIGVQVMISMGYIPLVDWLKISQDIQVTINKGYFDAIWNFLTHNLPFGGGFTIGFFLGLSQG